MTEISLDIEDYHLIIEISRLGFANFDKIMFATGNFSGDLSARLRKLLDMKLVEMVCTEETYYTITAKGLATVYVEDAFIRSLHIVNKSRLCRFKRLFLRQKA